MIDCGDHRPGAIDLWYGERLRCGHLGRPQRWINVLGRVVEPTARWLEWSLNGGSPRRANLGPNRTRLAGRGDFNIEIDTDELRPGINTVVLRSGDLSGDRIERRVVIESVSQTTPVPPCFIRWQDHRTLEEQAQVVDGRWTIGPGGARTAEIGYDRGIAVGDMSWRSYQVTAIATIHAIEAAPLPFPSVAPGIGILLHWQGHVDWTPPLWKSAARAALAHISQRWRDAPQRADEEPRRGWWPFGALGWYGWRDEEQRRGFALRLVGNDDRPLAGPRWRELETARPLRLKMRVQSPDKGPSRYALKAWHDGAPEPVDWDIVGSGVDGELKCGSVLLLAHHADVTFGDLDVIAIDDNAAA
jgi:hypothetical protein